MTGNEIRNKFLDYFKGRGHTIVPSSSLIPQDDPTILFTNAGMVQFKKVFLNEEIRDYKMAASSQKCMRVSGKHNDLENVGRTARHHTFFEMLGNFSFGAYFKKEAIEMGWEFLVKELHIPQSRLYATVFKDDDEANEIWRKVIGLKPDRIRRFGEDDNFWSMGDIGPCGPCSEIIYDQGEDFSCGKPNCDVGCDCDRYLELWNLVFMQYNRDKDGKLTPLPKPCIDTGMGLERLTAVIQDVKSNYETDLFMDIIKDIEEFTGVSYGEDDLKDISYRVIVDHTRAITFIIGDGVMPSNEGRGYVLRRIMRRAARHGKLINLSEPFLYKLSQVVIDKMQSAYQELKGASNLIAMVVQNEEERFLETLERGLEILNAEIVKLKSGKKKILPGDIVFKLYDTFGFPIDLTEDIIKTDGISIDRKGFDSAMEEQRNRARDAWRSGRELKSNSIYGKLASPSTNTKFIGYESIEGKSKILQLIKNGSSVEKVNKGDLVEIITESTPFYGESGGQVGDRGVIVKDGCVVEITDTLKPLQDLIVHKGRVKSGSIHLGDEVILKVDEETRRSTARNHTATHILQNVLRSLLGDHVKQSGSLVTPDRFRFDFTHFKAIDNKELVKIEELVNYKIMEDSQVDFKIVPYPEALSQGAMALFGEKYTDNVRVVNVGDYSKELCGGTHVNKTGEIGLFIILNESSVSAGIRRIEALTGKKALEYFGKQKEIIDTLTDKLKARPDEIYDRVERLLNLQKRMEKEIGELKASLMQRGSKDILTEYKVINGIKVISTEVEVENPQELRNLADSLKARIGSGILVLGAKRDNKVSLISSVTNDLLDRFDARDIISEPSKIVGGSGGGRKDLAQAGGNKPEKLKEALEKVYEIVGDKK